jgi:hypothetical protein
MSNTLVIEYGQRIDKRVEEFIKSSDGTRFDKVDLTDFDSENYFVNATINDLISSEAFTAMVASENVLAKEWNTPEEDKAWEHL